MRILGLYNNDCALELFEWLEDQGHDVVLRNTRIETQWCKDNAFDLAVSYTYRHILPQELIDALNNNVVNLHNSLLPWNRGADPNLWSIARETPRGVTLHYIDSELDKGYIIAQEFVDDCFEESNETLTGSYYNLDKAAKAMFRKAFKYYEYWPSLKKKCCGKGSYHSINDGKRLKEQISTYDIHISEYRRIIREKRL